MSCRSPDTAVGSPLCVSAWIVRAVATWYLLPMFALVAVDELFHKRTPLPSSIHTLEELEMAMALLASEGNSPAWD